MEKKYVACFMDYIGQTCDTREEAERAAKGMDYDSDAFTGYSTAFNCDPICRADVTEIEDRKISVEEYLKSEAKREKAEEAFRKEIDKLREKRLGKYADMRVAYVNTNTPYNYGDKIRLVTRKANGRKRTIEACVCGVVVEDNGEIRPNLRGTWYPRDEKILSIEVLERFDYKLVEKRVICKNCVYFLPHVPSGYSFGICAHHNYEVHFSKENQPCYKNNPNKYKDK